MDVLADQIDWITGLVQRGSIRIQALPVEGNPGLCARFRLVTSNKHRMVLYAEHVVGGEMMEKPELVSETVTLFSATQAEANCVEVAEGAVTGVRDSQSQNLGHLDVPAGEWAALVSTVRGQ